MKSLILILAGAACIYGSENLAITQPAVNYSLFAGFFLVVTGLHWPLYYGARQKNNQPAQIQRNLQDIRAHGSPKSFISLVKIISHAVSDGFSKHDMESCLLHMKRLKTGEYKILEFKMKYQHHHVPMSIRVQRQKGDVFDYTVSTIPALVTLVTRTIQSSKEKA